MQARWLGESSEQRNNLSEALRITKLQGMIEEESDLLHFL